MTVALDVLRGRLQERYPALGVVVDGQTVDVGGWWDRLAGVVAAIPGDAVTSRRCVLLVGDGADDVAEAIPDMEPDAAGAVGQRVVEADPAVGRLECCRFEESAGWNQRGAPWWRRGIGGELVYGAARGVGDVVAALEEPESVDERADVVGVLPGLPAIASRARLPALEQRVAPAADPPDLGVDESDTFEVLVLLGVVDRKALPGLPAV
jgi:hypothetical protein